MQSLGTKLVTYGKKLCRVAGPGLVPPLGFYMCAQSPVCAPWKKGKKNNIYMQSFIAFFVSFFLHSFLSLLVLVILIAHILDIRPARLSFPIILFTHTHTYRQASSTQ